MAKQASNKAAQTGKASTKAASTKGKGKASPLALKPNQWRLLAVIAKAGAKGTTYKGMRAATGMRKGLSRACGTPSKAQSAPHTLLALGLVSATNTLPYVYTLTAKGKQALASMPK